MTSTAKIIPIAEARESRRRRLSAEASAQPSKRTRRASVKESAKASTKAVKAEAAKKAAAIAEVEAAEQAPVKAESAAKSAKTAKASTKAAKAAKAATKKSAKAAKSNSVKVSEAQTEQVAAQAPARASVKASSRVTAEDAAKASAKRSAKTQRRADRSEAADATEEATQNSKTYAVRNWLNRVLSNRGTQAVALVLVLVVFIGVFMYPTARTRYQAVREQARLEAEFAAVLERNQNMADEIAFLQTEEGIIQEARETLGWVEKGESAVVVYGIERDSADELDSEVVSGSVRAPETWYSAILDPIFGVE